MLFRSDNKGGFIGYGQDHMWTHISGLTRLPYFNDLLVPHNIDVMHTEKNITEVLFATLMDIPDKSKDNVKARLDLATMCDRPKQVMKPPGAQQEMEDSGRFRLEKGPKEGSTTVDPDINVP